MDYSKEALLNKVYEIHKDKNFSVYANDREYEVKITDLAKKITVTKDIYNDIISLIEDKMVKEKDIAFSLYFILFTMCRRQKYKDILDLVDSYKEKFDEYYMMEHIDLMAKLDRVTHSSTLYKAIKQSSKFLKLKNDECNFSEHVGALNVYCGLVCKYFETNLDERKDSEKKDLIQAAYVNIQKAIKIDQERNANQSESAYSKFYLNRGRIQILKGKYTQGEADIYLAISSLGDSTDRVATVNEYNQYLLKASIIHAYDINEEKIQDLDKIKVSNYKSIALMTTLLGFLLGAINIFTTIEEPFTLAMLMLCYAGILLALLGIILFGLSLTLKDRKFRLLAYDIVLIILGIVIFGVSMWIILT